MEITDQGLIPERLPTGYTLQNNGLLGEGAFGAVYKFRHDETMEEAAVKFEMPGSNDQSVLRESLFMRDLDHKVLELTRIPKYLVHGTVKGARFLAMEYLEKSIKEYLKEVSDCPIKWRERICDVAVQMLEAVEEFHRTNKVHRDIKPDNFRVH